MTDIIIVAILVVIVGAASRYIYKAKKSGAKCIGCSVGEGGCSKSQSAGCGCGCGCGGEEPVSVEETEACCCCQSDESK